MAIYHATIKPFSRAKGQSSVSAAAYRAGLDLMDTTAKKLHRFSLRKGVVAYFQLAPAGSPSWCSDPSTFWDANEAMETRTNARVARELEVSLPHEMSDEQRQALALDLGQLLVDRYKAVVLVAIHRPSLTGDNRNHHVHCLMSSRELGPNGFGKKAGQVFEARGGEGANEIRRVRKIVEEMINARLAQAGLSQRVDSRSLRVQAMEAKAEGRHEDARALSRRPGRHVGPALTALLRKGAPIVVQPGRLLPHETRAAADEAAAPFKDAGRLMPVPPLHDATAARLEREREADTARNQRPLLLPSRPSPIVPGRGPTPLAYFLSQQARLGRTKGPGADVLNSQAALIEAWIDNMNEAARDALASLTSIPGLRPEQEVMTAVESALRRRVGLHASKPFFFEDSEELVERIIFYAEAVRRPHIVRERIGRAQAKLSELITSGLRKRDPKLAAARRALDTAKSGASAPARKQQDREISAARTAMTDAKQRMEDLFHVPDPDHAAPTASPPPEAGGGGDQLPDSARWRLRPGMGGPGRRPQ